MEQRTMHYDPKKKRVYIDAHESEFVLAFLKHLLEYYKIPTDVKIVYLRDVKPKDD